MSKIEELWIIFGSTSEEITAGHKKLTVSFVMVFFPKYDEDIKLPRVRLAVYATCS
jgi:hypothetical protein